MSVLPGVMADFLLNFEAVDDGTLKRPGVRALGDRLLRLLPRVAEEISRSDSCLVHGDFKAMNVFLPKAKDVVDPVIMIDMQWCGVGCGLSDLAMHLFHSVEVSALENGGEELVR